jgi:hopene-associated glycosyltransferase HpnB
MFLAALIPGTVCLLAWIYFLLAHGEFWRVSDLGSHVGPAPAITGKVAVVIPSRDEAAVIGETVQSLLAQTCADSIQIYVVDDHSSDGTATIAREAARACGRSQGLTVIVAQPLPPGWTGKLWAVQQGVEQALRLDPAFLLLTDADINHAPDNVATLVAIAEAGNYDLTSFMVKLHCRNLAEKLLIPAFVFFFFMLYPPAWIRDPKRKIAGAAGGCILIRPRALQKAGGISAIRDEIIDDCALARAVKGTGGRVWLGVTPNTFSTRAYNSFAEIERMIARTAFNQLQHSATLLAGTIIGMAITYLLPLAMLASRQLWLSVLGAACYLLMAVAYFPMVRFYGLRSSWALALPLSASFYVVATIHSAIQFWSGSGGTWKGRSQDKAKASAPLKSPGER